MGVVKGNFGDIIVTYSLKFVYGVATRVFFMSERKYRTRGQRLSMGQAGRLGAEAKVNRELAIIDELTGLLNRRGLTDEVEGFMPIADRGYMTLSLLVFDLDNFKNINDTYGHPEGDLALIEVAKILRKFFREGDILSRFGGDEFCVLMIASDTESSEKRAEELRQVIELMSNDDESIELSISGGVVTYELKEGWESIYTRADECLYNAKQEGGNQIWGSEGKITIATVELGH